MAAGVKPLSLPRHFNGVEYRARRCLLALDGITAAQSRPYSVTVRNPRLSITTPGAELAISSNSPAPYLMALSRESDRLVFSLFGC